MSSRVRFMSYPRTEPPPAFIPRVVEVFKVQEASICTVSLEKGLSSNEVLAELHPGLKDLGFDIESSKLQADKIERPVFYGENGVPTLNYQIDAYHDEWRCALEIEAGRAWMGNAIYRDLVQALVMVNVDHLVLGVANAYKYKNKGKPVISPDYEKAVAVADALYGHSRIQLPFGLTVIGY